MSVIRDTAGTPLSDGDRVRVVAPGVDDEAKVSFADPRLGLETLIVYLRYKSDGLRVMHKTRNDCIDVPKGWRVEKVVDEWPREGPPI